MFRAEKTLLEERIEARARAFELMPLLRALREGGYARDDIVFESNPEEDSPATLIERVRFLSDQRIVLVTVNLGLLGASGLLPAYFRQVVHQSLDPDAFLDFIRFFDNRLIWSFLDATYPELNGRTYRDFHRVRRHYFGMLGLGSETTLYWLVHAYFPELYVRVARSRFSQEDNDHAARPGVSRLDGSGIIGRRYQASGAGFYIDLVAQEERDDYGRIWAHEVRQRFSEWILPDLARHRVPFILRLTIVSHDSWVKLDDPSAEQRGFLGYERVRGAEGQAHRMTIVNASDALTFYSRPSAGFEAHSSGAGA